MTVTFINTFFRFVFKVVFNLHVNSCLNWRKFIIVKCLSDLEIIVSSEIGLIYDNECYYLLCSSLKLNIMSNMYS